MGTYSKGTGSEAEGLPRRCGVGGIENVPGAEGMAAEESDGAVEGVATERAAEEGEEGGGVSVESVRDDDDNSAHGPGS